ncbi:MAG: type II toxin-antitoxin system RelE/ParE family toxin [Phycisphaerales bacterium JB063]
MNLTFSSAAQTDLTASMLFYETQSEGLGTRFLASVYETCSNLRLFPNAGRIAFDDLRKMKVARFPFGVVYRVEHTEIVVYAVVDLRRDPERIESDLSRLEDE